MMSQCSICLNDMRNTRSNREIRCGHRFHGRCIEEWKKKGKNTCPLCRKVFDVSQFTLTINIHNNFSGRSSNVTNLDSGVLFTVMDVFEIRLDLEDRIEIESLIRELGIVLPSNNTLIADTE